MEICTNPFHSSDKVVKWAQTHDVFGKNIAFATQRNTHHGPNNY